MAVSHMPTNIVLTVKVVYNSVLESGDFTVRSAIEQRNRDINVQPIILPITSSYDNDDGNLTIMLDLRLVVASYVAVRNGVFAYDLTSDDDSDEQQRN